MKSGQSLKKARYGHSCSKMKIQGKLFLVVAGGANENDDSIDSVEILDVEFPDQGWTEGIKTVVSFSNLIIEHNHLNAS